MKKSGADVEVARIGRSSAVIVAVITTVLGGFGGAGLNYALNHPESEVRQRWLVIDGLEGEPYSHVRLVIDVNGVHYSYPSQAVWAEIGPGMSGERFPLPLGSDNYQISFSAFYLDPLAVPGLLSSNERFNFMPDFPSAEYRLFPLSGDGARSSEAAVRVRFRVQ